MMYFTQKRLSPKSATLSFIKQFAYSYNKTGNNIPCITIELKQAVL